MDEKTIREIINTLGKEKEKYVKLSEEVTNEKQKQCYISKIGGINISLNTICKLSKDNGIDVYDIKWWYYDHSLEDLLYWIEL